MLTLLLRKHTFALVLIVAACDFFLFTIAGRDVTKQFQQDLINRGFAEYNSKTGIWQYKEQPTVIFYKEETKQQPQPERKEIEGLKDLENPLPIVNPEEDEGLTLIPFILANNKSKKK